MNDIVIFYEITICVQAAVIFLTFEDKVPVNIEDASAEHDFFMLDNFIKIIL